MSASRAHDFTVRLFTALHPRFSGLMAEEYYAWGMDYGLGETAGLPYVLRRVGVDGHICVESLARATDGSFHFSRSFPGTDIAPVLSHITAGLTGEADDQALELVQQSFLGVVFATARTYTLAVRIYSTFCPEITSLAPAVLAPLGVSYQTTANGLPCIIAWGEIEGFSCYEQLSLGQDQHFRFSRVFSGPGRTPGQKIKKITSTLSADTDRQLLELLHGSVLYQLYVQAHS